MPEMSVTALELHTSVLYDKNPNAIVMMRDPKFLEEVAAACPGDDKAISRYVDRIDPTKTYTDEQKRVIKLAPDSLKKLKEIIRSSIPADQVKDYSCSVEATDRICKGKLTVPEKFGNAVLDFLEKRIKQQYPIEEHKTRSEYELQRGYHREFMEQRTASIVGQITEMDEIQKYIQGSYGESDVFATWSVAA